MKLKTSIILTIFLFNIIIAYTFFPITKVNASEPTYIESFASFTPVGIGWRNYNVYINHSIPTNSIVEILLYNENDAADRILGVRKDLSSFNRYLKIHEAEGGGGNGINMLVTVSSNGTIETYCDSTIGIKFYILGYWLGTTFTEMANIYDITSTGWNDLNVYSIYGIPKGSVIQTHIYSTEIASAYIAGVRTNNSSVIRYIDIHEAEGTGSNGQTDGYGTYVKSSVNSGIIETFSSSITNIHIMFLGYFDSKMDYVEDEYPLYIGVTGIWFTIDISSRVDIGGRIINLILLHDGRSSVDIIGARTETSYISRYVIEHEAETNGYTGFGILIMSSAIKTIQVYSLTSNDVFVFSGYFKHNILSYMTVYFTSYGTVYYNTTSVSNGTKVNIEDNVLLEGLANSNKTFIRWIINSTSYTTNPKIINIQYNTTIWCYFGLGYDEGYTAGWIVGNASGYTQGYNAGWLTGNTTGYNIGWLAGNTTGYNIGWLAGNTTGYNIGWSIGNATGYAQGYTDGYNDGSSSVVTQDNFPVGLIIGFCVALAIGYILFEER